MGKLSPEDIRILIGLNVNEAPNEALMPHIEFSILECLSDNAVYVSDDILSGNIDGTNRQFETTYKNLADTKFDGQVDAADIVVYGWIDSGNPSTKQLLHVESVDGKYGKIILQNPPNTSFEKITADYWYYRSEVDLTLMRKACALLTAYHFVLSEFLLVPTSMSHGALRYRIDKPYSAIYEEYNRVRELAFLSGSNIVSKSSHDQELKPMRKELA